MSLALLHSPADILRWALIGFSMGSDPNVTDPVTLLPVNPWPIYIDNEPDLPDNCITIYDTSPRDDGGEMITGENLQHYGTQIRIRALTHTVGYAKAHALQVVLNEVILRLSVVIDGTPYVLYSVSGVNVLRLGKDAPNSKRRLFTVNALFPVRRLQ